MSLTSEICLTNLAIGSISFPSTAPQAGITALPTIGDGVGNVCSGTAPDPVTVRQIREGIAALCIRAVTLRTVALVDTFTHANSFVIL